MVHHLKDQQEYDAIRQEIIEQQGIQVMVFANQEVEHNLEGVLLRIAAALTPTSDKPRSPLSLRERGRG